MNDTLAARRRPAEERLAEASNLLAHWRWEGRHPQVELGPARVEDVLSGERLEVPSRLLPEMFVLLAKSERVRLAEDPLRRPSGLRWADSGGGAA